MVKFENSTSLRAYECLVEGCRKKKRIYLTKQEADIALQSVSKEPFFPFKTFEDIYSYLQQGALIAYIFPARGNDRLIIPLRRGV